MRFPFQSVQLDLENEEDEAFYNITRYCLEEILAKNPKRLHLYDRYALSCWHTKLIERNLIFHADYGLIPRLDNDPRWLRP